MPAFDQLISSVRDPGEIHRGQKKAGRIFEFKPADVRRVKQKLSKSQTGFAVMTGASVATLRNWEQGWGAPDGLARALLKVVANNPTAVAEALSA